MKIVANQPTKSNLSSKQSVVLSYTDLEMVVELVQETIKTLNGVWSGEGAVTGRAGGS